MPSASGYRARYKYFHPNHERARAAAVARTGGLCESCSSKASEAHHYVRPYRLPEKITADDLSMFCRCCHDTSHDTIFFMSTGGTPAEFRSIVSEAVANAVLRRAGIEGGLRAGRPVLLADDEWGALVSGGSPPRPGEVAWLFLCSRRKWTPVVVTAVVATRAAGRGIGWSANGGRQPPTLQQSPRDRRREREIHSRCPGRCSLSADRGETGGVSLRAGPRRGMSGRSTRSCARARRATKSTGRARRYQPARGPPRRGGASAGVEHRLWVVQATGRDSPHRDSLAGAAGAGSLRGAYSTLGAGSAGRVQGVRSRWLPLSWRSLMTS